jgi:hypothetical protein
MAIEITSNYQRRHLVCFHEIPEKYHSDFDYIEEEEKYNARFFCYRGHCYDIYEFMRIETDMMPGPYRMPNYWHGYQSDSFFSGIVVRYCDDYESVIVGLFIVKDSD